MHPQTYLVGFLVAVAAPWLSAQDVSAPTQSVQAPPTTESVAPGPALMTAQELEEVVAPMALYPDPLVALILPAATSPSDIVLASRFLKANPQATSFDTQTWDDAVKLLAQYPTIVAWMDENLAWTQQLGDAFIQQPAEVMTTIQRLRARARAAGTLVDTPQQSVTVVGADIQIVPAQPNVIYIPTYDPEVVYVERPLYVSRPLISFSIGYAMGHWLAYDCDWNRRTICYVPRPDRVRVWHSYNRPTASVSLAWSSPNRFRDSHWRTWQPVYHPRDVHRRSEFVRGYASGPVSTMNRSTVSYSSRSGDSRRESVTGSASSRYQGPSPSSAAPSGDFSDRSRDRTDRTRDPSGPVSVTPEPQAPRTAVVGSASSRYQGPSTSTTTPSRDLSGRSRDRTDRSRDSSGPVTVTPEPQAQAPRTAVTGRVVSPNETHFRNYRPPQAASVPAARPERTYTPPTVAPTQRTERSYAPPTSSADRSQRSTSVRSDSEPRSRQPEARSRPSEGYSAPRTQSEPARAAEPSRSGRGDGERRESVRNPD